MDFDDGAFVMMRICNGVAARLKNKVNHNLQAFIVLHIELTLLL